MPDPSLPLDPRAESIFREFLARAGAGESADFEAICRANPTIERDLRRLKDSLDVIDHLRPRSGGDRPLSERLKQKFGTDPGPTVPLDPQPPSDANAESKLFDKLRGAGPRGTRYKMLGEVARGGMGVILKIWDDELRRTLAMKVVLGRGEESKGDTPQVDPRTLGRFLEEAQVTGQLDHPGIVPVHELGLDADGRVYFTMRLVKGKDLRSIFEKVRTGEDGWNQVRALGVMLKVCEAMSYAHSKKVVHRDLKPANVMVGKFGEVYVMDWGLGRVIGREDKHDLRIQQQAPTSLTGVKTDRREARDSDPDSPIVTMDGDIVGTPSFMPPEQAQGQLEKLGPHSDVYSVGAMLYALIAGSMPYVPGGARVSARTVLISVLNGPPKPLFELSPQTPAELIAIVEKAMARGISERYATMQALSEDLRAYIEGRVVHAYETGAWAEAKKWVKRNKPLAASLLVGVVILIGGVVASTVFASRATEKADQLEVANSALEKAKSDALANAERAEQKTNDVLSLSAQKDLDDLVARAEDLWPAQPEKIPEYEAWLKEARELIEGRPADPAQGLKRRPSLEEHKVKLAELRSKATALTAEQVKAERESHPKYAELQTRQSELTWHSRMLALEPWPNASEFEAQLATETLPSDANSLNVLAWPLVNPDTPVYGEEVRALLLASRAVKAAADSELANIRDTRAWALFKLGRFDDALAEEYAALAEPGGDALKASAARLENAVLSWDADELTKHRERRAALAAEVSELDRAVSERRTFDYEDPEARWWDVQLSKLMADLEALGDPETGLIGDTLAEPFGWGVTKRCEFARTIRERSVDGPEGKARWADAIAAVHSSPKYGGLELTAQLGLLPIGMDPDSGIWEFAHLQTGDVPERGADGKLALKDEMGLVFVLIPGGTFWRGTQKTDPTGQNYDPQAIPDEAPVHEVTLSPYFLSKYEMTQGQWERFTGKNPSRYRNGKYGSRFNKAGKRWSALHPVEQVSWTNCMELLGRLGCELPTEAQWENGCRAGTSSMYWSGDGLEDLGEVANIADAYAKTHGGQSWNCEQDIDDGNTVHAEVGSYRANAFGLHDVHGNVWEWCRDDYESYSPGKQVDPVRTWTGAPSCVYRGGSYVDAASDARSAIRSGWAPETQQNSLGLRPAYRVR